MKERFAVVIGQGAEQFTVIYDDYGNAAETALAYSQAGFVVALEQLKEH